jgi:hypothetical protein
MHVAADSKVATVPLLDSADVRAGASLLAIAAPVVELEQRVLALTDGFMSVRRWDQRAPVGGGTSSCRQILRARP